jgi:hypothetical protein
MEDDGAGAGPGAKGEGGLDNTPTRCSTDAPLNTATQSMGVMWPSRTWSSDIDASDASALHASAVERLGRGVFAHAAYVAQARQANGDDTSASNGAAAAHNASCAGHDAPLNTAIHEGAAHAPPSPLDDAEAAAAAVTPVASAVVDRVRVEQDKRAAAAAKWLARTQESRKGTDPLFMRNGSQWKRFGGVVIDDLTESTPLIDARSVVVGACARGGEHVAVLRLVGGDDECRCGGGGEWWR